MKLNNKIKVVLAILIFTIILLSLKVFATTGVVTEITVNVREKASTDSKLLMYVTQDDKVNVIEKTGDWYKINYKNKTGYVFSKYIKVDNTEDITENTKSEEKKENEEAQQEITKDVEKKLLIKKDTTIRIVPNISSNVIFTAQKDSSITIVEQINYWTYISVDNICGWVRTEKLIEENIESEMKNEENSETHTEESKTAYIKYTSVNLRKSATSNSDVLEKLKLNDKVTVIEIVDSKWSKVKFGDKTGYISSDLLSDTEQEEENKSTETTSRSGADTSREKNEISKDTKQEDVTENIATTQKDITLLKGEEVISYAKQYLGYKYVYGGASPTTGFDCSGFTSYVYKHFGYTLSRASTAQANNGTKIEKSDLQPGDILIFKNQSLSKIGHVGLYIGDNKMIHASEPGVGVVITDLDSKGYNYSKRFVMARRIIK